jgi:hypothetical protein
MPAANTACCFLPQFAALEDGAAAAQQQMCALGEAGAALEARAAALEAAAAEAGGCIVTHQVGRWRAGRRRLDPV